MPENKVKNVFESKFDRVPDIIVKAPGRINIIGEHTDYNDGYVLPAAIDKYMYLALAKNNTNTFNIYSVDFDQQVAVLSDNIVPGKISWLNLINGVINQLKDRISGFDLVFSGEVPVGAGLSSSAALCCGTAFGISTLFDLNLEKWDVVKIAQNSEHVFTNVQCGIMDQFASMFGKADKVLTLDCLNLTYEEAEIDITDYKFLLLDSNVKHQLDETDYNTRRVESASSLRILHKISNDINTFRDVDLDMLKSIETSDVWWKRAYHIVSENQRVLDLCAALSTHDMLHVGVLLNEGHISVRDYYEITCPETDFLFDTLIEEDLVVGTRQVGGGFGGCMLCLTKDENTDAMINRINNKYDKAFGKEVTQIPITISEGCHLLPE